MNKIPKNWHQMHQKSNLFRENTNQSYQKFSSHEEKADSRQKSRTASFLLPIPITSTPTAVASPPTGACTADSELQPDTLRRGTLTERPHRARPPPRPRLFPAGRPAKKVTRPARQERRSAGGAHGLPATTPAAAIAADFGGCWRFKNICKCIFK